ncbi:MAG: nucleotide exchange factor GrpE [bacterium]
MKVEEEEFAEQNNKRGNQKEEGEKAEDEGQDSEFVDEEESEQGPGTIKKLREKLQKTVEEKQEYLDGWQRARAEFANYKRQELGINADREDRSKAEFVENLLPALDVFEMALKHLPAQAGAPGSKELELVHKQLIDSLRRMGVEQFGKVGEAFDHYKHEALAQKGSGDSIESLERSGYSIGDKIVRPAQVII